MPGEHIPPLPPHLEELVGRAARGELLPTTDLLTAVDSNFYVLVWAAAYLIKNDREHILSRLQKVYDLGI